LYDYFTFADWCYTTNDAVDDRAVLADPSLVTRGMGSR
jgi:hypothetical protein